MNFFCSLCCLAAITLNWGLGKPSVVQAADEKKAAKKSDSWANFDPNSILGTPFYEPLADNTLRFDIAPEKAPPGRLIYVVYGKRKSSDPEKEPFLVIWQLGTLAETEKRLTIYPLRRMGRSSYGVGAESPDGKTMVFTIGFFGGRQTIFLFNLDTRTLRMGFADPDASTRTCWSPDGRYLAYSCLPEEDVNANLLKVWDSVSRRIWEVGWLDNYFNLSHICIAF